MPVSWHGAKPTVNFVSFSLGCLEFVIEICFVLFGMSGI